MTRPDGAPLPPGPFPGPPSPPAPVPGPVSPTWQAPTPPAPPVPPAPQPFIPPAALPPGSPFPAGPAATPWSGRRRRRRARRAWALLALVAVALVAGGSVVAVRAWQATRTPQAAVQAYFAALARGDAAAALAAGPLPEGGRVLVSAAVLQAGVALAPIDRIRTGTVVTDGDTGSVAVRYRIGGPSPQAVEDVVAVTRVDGRWRLERAAVPLSVVVDAAASWAGVPASTPFAVPDGVQLVFPGAAPVLFRTPVLEPDAAGRVVRMDTTDDALHVTAVVSEAGAAQVARTVAAGLESCAAGGTDVDPFCPQPPAGRDGLVVLRPVPQSFTGQLHGLDRLDPQIQVRPDAGGTLTATGSVDGQGAWRVLDYDNLSAERSGQTTVSYTATIAVGTPGRLAWDRG